MLLPGTPVESDRPRIWIPDIHRVVPNLQAGTRYRGIILPAQPENGCPAQFYISPFPKSSWTDIWSIEICVENKPGLLEKVSKVLSSPDVCINIVASVTSMGRMTLVCDMCRYQPIIMAPGGGKRPNLVDSCSQLREHEPHAHLPYLEDCLTMLLWEWIQFDNHRPRIRVHRYEEMRRIGRIAKEHGLTDFTVEVDENGEVFLNQTQWNTLFESIPQLSDFTSTFMVENDLEERYVRITPLSHRIAHIEIEHDDEVGMIAGFAEKFLSGPGTVNINSSWLFPVESGRRNMWKTVLECQGNDGADSHDIDMHLTELVRTLNQQSSIRARILPPVRRNEDPARIQSDSDNGRRMGEDVSEFPGTDDGPADWPLDSGDPVNSAMPYFPNNKFPASDEESNASRPKERKRSRPPWLNPGK